MNYRASNLLEKLQMLFSGVYFFSEKEKKLRKRNEESFKLFDLNGVDFIWPSKSMDY